MQDLTLDRLAGAAGLSRFYFLRAFRSEIGVTPHAYLTGRRIAAAKRLLDGEQALSEVALACGFYDQIHFTRAFNVATCVTPGQYLLLLASAPLSAFRLFLSRLFNPAFPCSGMSCLHPP